MSKLVPKRVLEDIRFKNDIADVIGSYFDLKRMGSSIKALCPFHKEKTPSFNINQQRQIFHCFGCGAGGDVFRFVMQYESVDFMEAVKILADRAGIELEVEESEKGGADKKSLYKLLSDAAAYYQRVLFEGKSAGKATAYLKKRKLDDDICKEFLVGYAPSGWRTILDAAQKKKYSLEQLESAGLILQSSKPNAKSDYYDRFRERLMFSICDEQGRVIGFSGRTLDDDSKAAKYVNSPETPVFYKSRVLYAIDKARRNIVETREAIVCEGQIDVIRCHQAGFKTAVAAQGTAFTEDHVRMLRRYADSICIVFDQDKAGQDAAVRAATEFLKAGLVVRVAILPKKDDPDSFILKNGAKAFQKVLDASESVVCFQISVLSEREDIKSEIGAMRVAKAVLQTINQSPNAVQRSKLVQEAAERLRLPASSLQDDLKFMKNREYRGASSANAKPDKQEPVEKVPAEEIALCEHLVHVVDFPEMGKLVKHYLPLGMLAHTYSQQIIKAAMDSLETGREIMVVLNDYDQSSSGLHKFAARVQMAPTKVKGEDRSSIDAVKDLILRLWQKRLKNERKEIQQKLIEGDQDSEVEFHQLRSDLRALTNWEEGQAIIEIRLEE